MELTPKQQEESHTCQNCLHIKKWQENLRLCNKCIDAEELYAEWKPQAQ